jgi:hypothetical protein
LQTFKQSLAAAVEASTTCARYLQRVVAVSHSKSQFRLQNIVFNFSLLIKMLRVLVLAPKAAADL